MVENCTGANFSLTGNKGAEYFEGVDAFKYEGQVLCRTDADWMAVQYNILREIQVWERLRKLSGREGADPRTSETFYRAVVQVVLLFGSKTWVLLSAMLNKLEGLHMGFLQREMGMKARRLGDKT